MEEYTVEYTDGTSATLRWPTLQEINDERIWCDALWEDMQRMVTERGDISDE